MVEMGDGAAYFYFKNYSVPKDSPIHNAPNSQALCDATKDQTMWMPSEVIIDRVAAITSNAHLEEAFRYYFFQLL